ncbi:unnamed protein product [Cylicocyclus nassatus]|uniref:Uncharacterized protein n=1 Tax=Cylicocyclus nassatus TaxID=53992 RepID=A0AA36DN19_CYLNA|nr:unnamed protein product [Cylicocyclus nassatus]
MGHRNVRETRLVCCMKVAKNKFNANEQSKGDKRYPVKIISDLVCEVRTSQCVRTVSKSFATSHLHAWR